MTLNQKPEIPKITSKDLELLKVKLSTLEWDDVASNLITLEIEYHKIKKHLNKKEAQSFRKLMKIYELEKYRRIQEIERNNEASYYGPAEGSPSWLDDEPFLE